MQKLGFQTISGTLSCLGNKNDAGLLGAQCLICAPLDVWKSEGRLMDIGAWKFESVVAERKIYCMDSG